MKRGGMFYEVSFFIILAFILVNKWIEDPMKRKVALIILGVTVFYQLLYILVLGRKDYISIGRCLAIGGFYISLIILILSLIYLIIQYFYVGTVAGLFSLNGLFEFYSIPMFVQTPYLGIIPIALSLIYMFAYILITKRQYLRSGF